MPHPADRGYYQCWLGLKSHFDPGWTPEQAAAAEAVARSKAATGSGQQLQEQLQHNGTAAVEALATP